MIDLSDYLIELTSPSGTKSILMTPFNNFQAGFNATNWVLASHAFYGERAQGTWTLTIRDLDNDKDEEERRSVTSIKHIGEGKLDRFQLTFYGR